MKNIFKKSALLSFGLLTLSTISAKPKVSSPPNIIVIFCDDLGYGDLACYGASQYQTPHLDRMANQGMKFTNFYAAQAVCSASRAAILTGCYPNRVGISGALMPWSEIGLNPEEETIAEVLKKKDYSTIAIGKWHLGNHREFLPLQQGFDQYFGIPYSNDMWPFNYDGTRASSDSNTRKSRHPELPLIEGNDKIREFRNIEEQAQITTLLTERAVKYIGEHRKKPFFMYLAHPMPHVPLAVSDKFKGKSPQGIYGDVISEIDWSVGEIVKTLDEYKLSDNTLIIFTSDNGPWLNFGDHAGSTGGLREGKGCSTEGGQRVPCIVKWPATIQAGTVCSNISSTIDLLPTFASIAGAALPSKKIDGVNILPLLKGDFEANPRNTLLYYYRENNLEAVREGNWKLVFAHPGRSYEGFQPGKGGVPGPSNENFKFEKGLYDLRRDPGERYNLIGYHPEVVERLEKIASEARNDLGDKLTDSPGINRREPGRIKK